METDEICKLSPNASFDEQCRFRQYCRLLREQYGTTSLVVEFEGLRFEIAIDYSLPDPGEMYFAARNSGWKLLTCSYVKWWENEDGSKGPDFIVPEEIAYCYDIGEQYKIISWIEE